MDKDFKVLEFDPEKDYIVVFKKGSATREQMSRVSLSIPRKSPVWMIEVEDLNDIKAINIQIDKANSEIRRLAIVKEANKRSPWRGK